MRIGIDATSLPAAPAGAGRYIHGLITGLTALDVRHTYFVFIKESDRHRFTDFERPNVKVVTIPSSRRPTRLFWEMIRAPRVIEHFRLDVWHAPHYVVPLIPPRRCRTVVTFHDMVFHVFPELHPRTKRLVFRWMLPHAARVADRIIAISRATREETSRILRVDPGRIRVVHPGIDAAFRPVGAPETLAAVLRRYRIEAPYLLAVGTIERRKNLLTLLDAYRTLVDQGRIDCRLVIAGQPGDGYDALVRAITACGLTDRIRLPGYVAEDDLPALYSGARLFVSASRYEGFGFPALEAMACGTPALTSPSPSIMETTTQGRMIEDPMDVSAWCDRIEGMAAHPPAHAEQVIAGRRLAARHAWTVVARETLRVYEETAGEGASFASSGRQVTASHAAPTPNGALPRAILKTIVYADLFDYPLSAREVHAGLIGYQASQGQVAAALRTRRLSRVIVEQDERYMLRGREGLGRERTRRSEYAARLFHRNRRILRLLCACPFVRMVALSGALAFENCREDSDIDLFLIVDARRIWSTYAFLAAAAKLTRKRELLCMNYLVGRPDCRIEDHDFYTAHQIASLKPLYGWDRFRRFTASNGWVMRYLPQWSGYPNGKSGFAELRLPRPLSCIKHALELLLRLPVFSPIEELIYRAYRRRLGRKAIEKPGGLRLTRDRIKLHSNDHSRRVMDRFRRRFAEVLAQEERAGETADPESGALNVIHPQPP